MSAALVRAEAIPWPQFHPIYLCFKAEALLQLGAASGPAVSGVVKWFSPDKGFGFVELFDGSGDAFLHGSVLAQNGIGAVQRAKPWKFA
jgi:hypothetical protein